ncbi:MAG: hypothetical protein WA705_11270 [Candidatus Ozemobacteraceae bacterium]
MTKHRRTTPEHAVSQKSLPILRCAFRQTFRNRIIASGIGRKKRFP